LIKNLKRFCDLCNTTNWASEAFKIEVLKNAYKKIWAKNSIAIVKNMHNVGLKNLKNKFLAIVGQFKFKTKS
jgi:hypothetical protein